MNCEWKLKGKLTKNTESEFSSDGKCYDGKLYTFKETNYKKAFEILIIMVKPLEDLNIRNNSEY